MTERNYWKYATIIIIIGILVLSGILINQEVKIRKSESYDFSGLKINKAIFDEMSDQFGQGEDFRLCRMSDNYCIAFKK